MFLVVWFCGLVLVDLVVLFWEGEWIGSFGNFIVFVVLFSLIYDYGDKNGIEWIMNLMI